MFRYALASLIVGLGILFPAHLFAQTPADQTPVLTAGFVEFPPFKYADENGNASGPWVEMTEKVAAAAGYRLDWVHLPIARVYLYLKSGRIDLWPGVAGIPQIQDSVYESSVTPMRVTLYAFHRDQVERPESLKSLVDKPLILINGFTYLGALKDVALDAADLSYAPGHESALRMLQLGRGQYVLDYDEPVRAVQQQFPELDLTGTPIFEARGAFIVSRANPDGDIILERLDDAYRHLVESGQVKALQ